MSGSAEGDSEPKSEHPLDFRVAHSAWQGIEEVRESQSTFAGTKGLRIAVRGGGCSGLTYVLGWEERKDDDVVIVGPTPPHNTVYVDKRSLLFLKGSELIWVNDTLGQYFTVRNPNAKSTCGCGESFSV